MNRIIDSICGITLGPAVVARNLTVFPILENEPSGLEILAASDALEAGLLKITEMSEHGTVPRLRLTNDATLPALLLDGEHLVGCKQNRVLNTTVLAPAHSEIELPVSCVEQGRWGHSRSDAALGSSAMFSELRAEKVRQVSRSMETRHSPQADQGAIWASIGRKSARMGSTSRSAAMEGIYLKRTDDLASYDIVTRPAPNQRGSIFAINGYIVGVETLVTARLWQKCGMRIASGYALDALDYYTPVHGQAKEAEAREFIDRVRRLARKPFSSVGLGEDVRLDSSETAGAALVHDGELVHLYAFDLAGKGEGSERTRSDRRGSTTRRAARPGFGAD